MTRKSQAALSWFAFSTVVVVVAAILIWKGQTGRPSESTDRNPTQSSELLTNHLKPKTTETGYSRLPSSLHSATTSTTLPGQKEEREPLMMDLPIEARQAFADSLRTTNVTELVEYLLRLMKTEDYIRRGIVADVIATNIRSLNQSEIKTTLQSLGQIFAEDRTTIEGKRAILEVLGHAQTKETVEFLLDTLPSFQGGELRDLLVRQIEQTGNDRWGGKFHEELSPVLVNAWQKEELDKVLSSALVTAIASVGAPEGVSNLIQRITGSGTTTLDDLRAGRDENAMAALAALQRLRNPSAVPDLELRLGKPTGNDLEVYASGTALAAIGTEAAADALLKWAQQTNARYSEFAAKWFTLLRGRQSLANVRTALEATPNTFNSSEVRSAIEKVVSSDASK